MKNEIKTLSLGRELYKVVSLKNVEKIVFLLQSLFSVIPYKRYERPRGY